MSLPSWAYRVGVKQTRFTEERREKRAVISRRAEAAIRMLAVR
jgi:hypothetical protein